MSKEQTHKNIVDKIEGLRMTYGYSIEQICKNAGVNINDYTDMLDGIASPTLKTLIALWDALNIDSRCVQ